MSVPDLSTIRQCLSMLPLGHFSSPFLDYRIQKLKSVNLIKLFVTAQLCKWESLRHIQLELKADGELQQEFECQISASQLCRRMDDFPTCVLEALFHAMLARIHRMTPPNPSSTKERLLIVDSTHLRLPPLIGDWTYVTRHRSGIKVHTRLVALPDGSCFPDRIVPSTGNVSDYEGSDLLVVEPDATYLMDRGYACYSRMDRWLEQGTRFIVRLSHHKIKQTLEAYPTDPDDPNLLRDAIVYFGATSKMKHPIRLIEFRDEKGRLYRVATNRYDLSVREIADLYRHRWRIELFFRWMKQHLAFAKLYSYKPQAVWNHILLAMIAYSLLFLLRLGTQTKKSLWELMRLLRVYAFRSYKVFLEVLYERPVRSSLGRQKLKDPPPKVVAHGQGVALVKQPKKRR